MPNGIGYVGLAYIKAGGIKVVPIDGVMPSVQSVHAKTYPYARPTFYYTNGEPGGLAKQFLDFTIGSAGKRSSPRSASFRSSRRSSSEFQADNAVWLTRKPAGFSPAGFSLFRSEQRAEQVFFPRASRAGFSAIREIKPRSWPNTLFGLSKGT